LVFFSAGLGPIAQNAPGCPSRPRCPRDSDGHSHPPSIDCKNVPVVPSFFAIQALTLTSVSSPSSPNGWVPSKRH
jgi:hypothetical protein